MFTRNAQPSTLRNRLSSAAVSLTMVAVLASAFFVWGSSAHAISAIGEEVVRNRNQNYANFLTKFAFLPPEQKIEQKKQQRASECGTTNPSSPVHQRF